MRCRINTLIHSPRSELSEKVRIAANGRLVLPKALRDAAGISGETELLLTFRDGQIQISTITDRVRRVQELYRQHVKHDFSSDDFPEKRPRLKVVLDGSAIIALLKNEPGSEVVVAHLADAAISAVNLQEIVKKMLEAGLHEPIIRQMIGELGVVILPHDSDDAFRAAALADATRQHGSGLGDRPGLEIVLAR